MVRLHANARCCRITGGEVAEWPIAPVLKTGEVRASAGSNPALSAGPKTPRTVKPFGAFLRVFLVAVDGQARLPMIAWPPR